VLLVGQHYPFPGEIIDLAGHGSVTHREGEFLGYGPGIVTMAISPSQVLHSQPLLESFWT
jgi:hypothetical protein